ncbi:metal ABC transporter ATP-binding protein [Lachnoclostridium phytofermentans]|uniref:ABC transporter related n=1 Tax=Lachnoclostridium phytofermentans (strain ATCC 700394 / DSM 18823 / ISDg) TaxID=357809 RepID=A9KHZ4_LACP7|nr:metal ABC transporter ATP-binding protein [Lachnoclostridium phytofermentans]ABX43841.1 ABC transporter related [Lachnoclostridium phytofermentans ISDg]
MEQQKSSPNIKKDKSQIELICSSCMNQHESCSKGACGRHCIRMNDIGVTIGKTTIIEHINLHIHCGKLTVIIGKNGAGKSTLIKAILGELKHEGTIEFKDMKNNTLPKMTVGYVPQSLNVEKNTPTSVYDMFAGLIDSRPVFLPRKKRLYEDIKEKLRFFEAQDLIDKRVCDLSGGELQRVMLSIACTPTPNLLLLDEPVSGIDRNGMELFYRNIEMLKNNYDCAFILVSHDLKFVEKYADHVILLDKHILKEGTPKEVLSSKEFKEVFGA